MEDQEIWELENGARVYITQQLYQSVAFNSLKGFAPQLLLHMYGKRSKGTISRGKKGKKDVLHWKNWNRITITYLELENLWEHQAKLWPGNLKKNRGVHRGKIQRAIDDLLAKGFFIMIKQGGAGKRDKSIFAMSRAWETWKPGDVCSTRPKDVKRGYRGLQIGATSPRHKDKSERAAKAF